MNQHLLTPVSIIIPTTCERARWDSLQKAIASVLEQEHVAVQVIAVVNGQRYDEECFKALKGIDKVTVLYRETGSAPLAQWAGRDIVETPFFGFLDDDDEYLPGAVTARLAPMLADSNVDFVVTNGYRALRKGGERLAIGEASAIHADPLMALCDQNWMASCGGLFRTRTVTADYFADPAPYMEWTYLAFRLTARLNMVWLDTPTYRINNSPASLSKSDAYLLSELDIVQRVLALPLPAAARRAVRRKLGRTCHAFAEKSRSERKLPEAWRFHLQSLTHPGGWRYLPYSRKLVHDYWRGLRASA